MAEKKKQKAPVKTELLYIIIPAYNESGRIGKVIATLPKSIHVADRKFDVKIVVIDDCSKDGTHKEAKEAGARVLRHVVNCGAGAATRTGLVYVSQLEEPVAYAVAIDADGQHSSSDVKNLLECAIATDADMVVGNRLHDGNKISMPAHRKFGNWGLSFVSRILFGIKVKDTQSGLRAFRGSALPIVSMYTIDRYGFATDMLWAAQRGGLHVCETPIEVKYSKETLAKGQNNWGAVHLILDLLWIRIAGSV